MLRNIKNREGQIVPCGKCENCRKTRISSWSFRLMNEDRAATSSYFLTLTYDTDNVPLTRAGYMDLSKRDLQLFFKRLRRWHDRKAGNSLPLKYYAVGEYGGRYMRPHYHVILFNADLEILIGKPMAMAVRRGDIELDGKRPFMCESWSHHKEDRPIGHITIGSVSEASVGYTMKYVSKVSKVPLHRNDDRTPEFSLMSKGLGVNYLTKAMVNWHMSDMQNRQYCVLQDGKKIAMPRYYKEKMLNEEEREILRQLNVLAGFEKPRKHELNSKHRSEAYYAGLERMKTNQRKDQKF